MVDYWARSNHGSRWVLRAGEECYYPGGGREVGVNSQCVAVTPTVIRNSGGRIGRLRANYLIFGLQPLWFHLTNVLLHAAACVLFARVCICVAGLKPPFATLAALLFAAHPIHTEAVSKHI
ncbi:unnamed protein product [Brassicogethes aeneus]|uniref:Uncharacterized protein n=1 Tax=Brassicogethes aeneus TaxID=1431903 RepID=A0A9P0B1X4_BRAAE|nr:unnamed protein product [Brassicogethes aeneus]